MALESLYMHLAPSLVTIVCPDEDVVVFSQFQSYSGLRVVSESEFMPSFRCSDAAARLESKPHRAGWYYQQILKMNYHNYCTSSTYLIWDLDTIILNRFPFFSNCGAYILGSSREHNNAYFRTIDLLLGPGPFPPQSAICQYMIIDSNLMKNLLSSIEKRTGLNWYEAITSSLPQKHNSEFSEYETYATYLFRTRPDKFLHQKARLFRYGAELSASPRSAYQLARELSRNFDLLAFEMHSPSFLRKIYAYTIKLFPFLLRL
jgi:hypothetical protein